jgi:hypothetical protein
LLGDSGKTAGDLRLEFNEQVVGRMREDLRLALVGGELEKMTLEVWCDVRCWIFWKLATI